MKTPNSRYASGGFGKQLDLLEPAPFSLKYPNPTTLAGKALKLLLKGQYITHPDFENLTGSWRLSECIRSLRHDFGWPIETIEIPAPPKYAPDRYVGKYKMPQWVQKMVGESSWV